MAHLPRWKIREPNHREFEEFKRQFLLGKAETTKVKELLRYIGELQSEVDTLKHALATCQKMTHQEYREFMIEMRKAERIDNNLKEKLGRRAKVEFDKMRQVLIANNLTW